MTFSFYRSIESIRRSFLRFMLVFAEGARLFQEAIHKRGFAVVNVRDDRDISDVLHRF